MFILRGGGIGGAGRGGFIFSMSGVRSRGRRNRRRFWEVVVGGIMCVLFLSWALIVSSR